jgi:hypothetical protein
MTDQPARFPPPWTVEEYRDIAYIVRDANNFAVAYIYFTSKSDHTRYLMSKDEARAIATTIAKLPDLLGATERDTGNALIQRRP